ncbi:hypothetical protein GJ496_011761 [Pomphorhynchus laevis]|nr:hypothetical protein GJ496_011761 [Pomphorhynchus laevis]
MAYLHVLTASSILVNFIGITMAVDFSEWKALTVCTTEGVSTTEIDCKSDIIQIGHSHYGVKYSKNTGKLSCRADFDDCVMDYTTKLSERCNGLSRCSMSLLKQFIHKCKDPASYLHMSYRCVKVPEHSDICKSTEYRAKQAHIVSTLFPHDYPKNVDCTCIANRAENTVLITEAVNFQVLQPDIVNIQLNNSSPAKPLFVSNASLIINDQGPAVIRFQSDSSLSRSGFWMKLSAYPSCPSDWEPVDDKCVRLIKHKLPWHFASEKCHSIGGHLLTIRENSRRLRIQNMLSNYGITKSDSIWIGLKFTGNSLKWMDGTGQIWKDDAIWPWDKSKYPSDKLSCTSQYEHRWQMEDCDDTKYFICEQDLSRVKQEILMTCGPSSNLERVTAYAIKSPIIYEPPTLNLIDSEDALSNDFKKGAMGGHRYQISYMKAIRSNESVRLSLVLTFMILVLIALIICNVLLIYLCQKRLKKTIQSSSSYAINGPKPKSLFNKCWRKSNKDRRKSVYPFDTLSPLHSPSCYSHHDCCYTTHHRGCKQRFLPHFHTLRRGDSNQNTNHFYEPVIQNATDSGYSTVPKRCCIICRAKLTSTVNSIYQQSNHQIYYPVVNNGSAVAVDDLLFNKTLSKSPKSTDN